LVPREIRLCAGGLTEAHALAEVAKRRGLRIMAGGTIGTSLGIVPVLLVAQLAEIVDLDGPLHLASDRLPALRYDGSTISPPEPNLWGGPG
jgi:L-alanine-DL-glutamate epimerase-like enolase superfamily enzyme